MKVRSSFRLFDPAFVRRALGFGPQASTGAKTLRGLKLAWWYSPGSGWVHRGLEMAAGAGPYSEDPYPVRAPAADTVLEDGSLFDEEREIGLSYSIVRPVDADGPMPVVIYSIPMIWGRRHTAPPANYLSEFLARAGYMVIRVRHTDSDRKIYPDDVDDMADRYAYISDNMRAPELAHHRFRDLPFMMDCLEDWNQPHGRLAGQIDTSRIGLSGHSFGCKTVFAAIGEIIGDGGFDYRDDRVKAVIAYCRTPALDPHEPDATFAQIKTPVLHMGGSRDIAWSEPTLPEDRLCAYSKIDATDQYRLMLKGADHQTFPGGRDDAGIARPLEQRNHQLIKSVSLAFWDAYLRDDLAAKAWLQEEFPAVLGNGGRFEWK